MARFQEEEESLQRLPLVEVDDDDVDDGDDDKDVCNILAPW